MTKRYVSPPNWPAPPAGWTPPAGWKPDPKWGPAPKDWAFWQEDASWFARHKVLTGVGAGGLGMLVLISALGNGASQTTAAPPAVSSVASTMQPSPATPPAAATPAETTSAAAPTQKPAVTPTPDAPARSSEPGAPKQQQEFVSRVEKAQAEAADANNDLQIGAALSRRDEALCKVVKNGKAQSWTGTIDTLDSNGDGYGVLSIKISDSAAVGTWNNALSDFEDNTLIKPGQLLDDLSSMEEGQKVAFTGKFVRSGSCVNDKRLTKSGKINDPEFVFKFTSVKAL